MGHQMPVDLNPIGRADFFETIEGDRLIRHESSLPGDHPYYALIGRVAAEWTHFEHMLDEIIWNLAQIPDDTALCITGHIMGATPRFKMIESLGKYFGVPEELLKRARQLKQLQYEVGELRNRVVHDPWFVVSWTAADGAPRTTQLKSTPPGHAEIPKEDVEQTIIRIRSLVIQAAHLGIAFRETLYTLRNKPPELPPASPQDGAQ
jgi:hypothetical protein